MALDPNEKPGQPITKFESMLKTDDVYFFDAEDFEDIIHYYLNNGKIGLAKKAIRIGLQQHPDSTDLKLLDVEVLVFEDKLDVAEKYLDELQLLDSHNEEIYIQRANIYSKKDNHDAAVTLLKKALELSENSLDIYSLLGMEYLFMDNFNLAKESFMKCVNFDNQDYSSLYNVIYCFEFLEDFDGAITYLNEYLERNPYCEVAWHQLGKQYFSKKMYKEALASFDFAIISDDSFLGAYFEKGKVLEKMGKYNEAIESYETTISIEDPTSHAYLRIGKCHEKLQNDDMAQYYYYQTVHEDPLLDKGWLAITDFYFKKGKYERALYYINKAINIDGENPLYWKKCARTYQALKNFHEADFAYKQAVDLGNYEMDTWIQWSQVVRENNDFESVVQILKQGLEFYPESTEIEYRLVGAFLALNKFSQAKKHLLNALQNSPEGKTVLEVEYPRYYSTEWVVNIITNSQKASR
ncbi:tetratricopeptide repeat protein [Costertonia aggregata]|uniref:Tetratricopeptide repeat protein n=1 Tax=Costertonia aggregata TaxID=343403 RepID=A0A7H9AKX1_9FLAO|nr:tetratricopeptide repeat protein [Costertonia aggregata]QLG44121.1 tetratricopeptide repeat protein [Costertonia aggregata]